MTRPLTDKGAPAVAVIGLGGYAGTHHAVLRRLEEAGECRVVGTCSPTRTPGEEEVITRERLQERGVRLEWSAEALLDGLAGQVDGVLAATPLARHEADHALAVTQGVPLYLEKPPTLDPAAWGRMVEREAMARRPTVVGFQAMADPLRLELKERMARGEWGRVREVRFLGCWPRPRAYYTRTGWAGRLVVEGRLVLDSVLGNAMSHYLNNVLFWAGGAGVWSWGRPAEVQAWLARAHAIESADTVALRLVLEDGVEVRFAGTHACAGVRVLRETVVLERGRVEWEAEGEARVTGADGAVEARRTPLDLRPGALGLETASLGRFVRALGGREERGGMMLGECAAFMEAHAAAFAHAGRIKMLEAREAAEGRLNVPGLEEGLREFVEAGRWPGETPRVVAWEGLPGGAEFASAVAGLLSAEAAMFPGCQETATE